MRIVHVIPRLITESSGPSYSVPQLCAAQARQGAEVELHLVGEASANIPEGIEVYSYVPDRLTSIACGSREMKRGLKKASERADIIHNHSLWMLPNIYPSRSLSSSGNCKLVISPRGTFSNWAMKRSRLKKQLMWWFGQRRTCERAALFHATSAEECLNIRGLGLRQPVTVIPNGIDFPVGVNEIPSKKRKKTVLFLSRIHPKKGVEKLLKAWREVGCDHPDWNLQIAGPLNNSYAKKMKDLSQKLKLKRVDFTGELRSEAKQLYYRNSSLFVLPTESENFGLVVAEALAAGVPAIVTQGAPWAGLQKEGCGWWIYNSTEILIETLRDAMSLPPEELERMGMKGRSWMEREFAWDAIAANMLASYQWIHDRGAMPECISDLNLECLGNFQRPWRLPS